MAESKVNEMAETAGIPVSIVDKQTLDRDWCWVFFYQSQAFLQTGSRSDLLAGNGPIMVEKATGRLHVLVTARPLEKQLERLRADRFGTDSPPDD